MNLWKLIAVSWALGCSLAPAQQLESGIDAKGIDASVRVQDNLFQYANGEWLKHTQIPADKSNYGAFGILHDEAQANIREIVAEAVGSNSPQGSDVQKIGDFFRSYMDEATIDRCGIGPLREQLAKIDQLSSKQHVMEHFGYLQSLDVTTPVGFYVDQDDKNSSQYLGVLIQNGISLPDRDYYLKDDEKYESARAALKDYIERLFTLSDLPDGQSAAETILALETRLAEAHWTRTDLRDAEKRYNKYAVGALEPLMPGFAWDAFLSAAQVGHIESINIATPSYFQAASSIIEDTSVEVWRHYLKFQLINAYANGLPKVFVDARFKLYGTELAGVPEQKPRWKRAVQALAGSRGFGVLGDAVGRLYVKKHYPAAARERMAELVENLILAYRKSIRELTWMTPATKEKALEKLAKITTKVGHTQQWRDYTALEIKADDLTGNLIGSARVEYQRMIDKLGQSIDRAEWHMTPQTVNAYYNPSMNEIVFPAAILQPPFFHVTADDAVNYGSIGAVIGHEISHAFDDQGSKYDGDGNLNNWWTDQDRAAFAELTKQLVDQFEQYSPLEGRNVNGRLTLGENIADLSGMSIAYKAYMIVTDGEQSPVIDGWTGPQRFFLGWAQSWRRKYRPAEMMNRLLTDPHSPAEYRSYGPCTNFDPFYEAFNLKPGDGLYRPPTQRTRIW
ncbi:MAG: peptidase M13 [Pirellulales bacterium]|nr:peptidase M13 [Pirellulales bacterium]